MLLGAGEEFPCVVRDGPPRLVGFGDDAVSVDPEACKGVRVAFTLTYPGMNRLDGPTHSALVDLLGAGSGEA